MEPSPVLGPQGGVSTRFLNEILGESSKLNLRNVTVVGLAGELRRKVVPRSPPFRLTRIADCCLRCCADTPRDSLDVNTIAELKCRGTRRDREACRRSQVYERSARGLHRAGLETLVCT